MKCAKVHLLNCNWNLKVDSLHDNQSLERKFDQLFDMTKIDSMHILHKQTQIYTWFS